MGGPSPPVQPTSNDVCSSNLTTSSSGISDNVVSTHNPSISSIIQLPLLKFPSTCVAPINAASDNECTQICSDQVVGSLVPSVFNPVTFLGMNPTTILHKSKTHRRGKRGVQQIFNLSTHILSSNDISLLSKGLIFSPTVQPNPFVHFKDLNKFIRDLTVNRFYNIKSTDKLSTTDTPASEISVALTPFDILNYPY